VKIALYARVSKADESQDPENQLMRLRAYSKERGWEVFEEYVDMASGADANRPSLKRMLKDANARRFGLVLTTKIDRIARSSLDLKLLISELEGRGIKFECSDQPFSTNTPTGRLLFGILGEIAEFERSLIVERTKAGLARARAQGKRLGHPRLEVGWKGHPRLDTARIHALRIQGMSYRVIAKQLGISHQTVKNRLRNEGPNPPNEKSESGGGIGNGR
jgi:DNA invertase Pin-like site-specific DNA recombinase